MSRKIKNGDRPCAGQSEKAVSPKTDNGESQCCGCTIRNCEAIQPRPTSMIAAIDSAVNPLQKNASHHPDTGNDSVQQSDSVVNAGSKNSEAIELLAELGRLLIEAELADLMPTAASARGDSQPPETNRLPSTDLTRSLITMPEKPKNNLVLKQLSDQAPQQSEAAKTDEVIIVGVNQAAEAEPEFTDEQLDALAEAYALLISLTDEETEAKQYWPESVLDPIRFLQGRANVTIDLEGQTLDLLSDIDIGGQIDCVNHLLTEAADLKRLCLSHSAFFSAETCDLVIDLAQRTKSTLEKSILLGEHNANPT